MTLTPEDIAWAIDAALQEHSKRTRRDAFAKAALTEVLAYHGAGLDNRTAATNAAIEIADALIAALDKAKA